MYVAGLFENPGLFRRAGKGADRGGLPITQVFLSGVLETALESAICLTFFGFTSGRCLHGGTKTSTVKGAVSSEYIGGVNI